MEPGGTSHEGRDPPERYPDLIKGMRAPSVVENGEERIRPDVMAFLMQAAQAGHLARLRSLAEARYRTINSLKSEFVNATRAGNNEVVERVVDKKIRVVAYSLNNGGAAVATVHFRSGSRPISSTKDLAADGGGMVQALSEGFWFETAVGEALNINLAADGAVGVDVMYLEVET